VGDLSGMATNLSNLGVIYADLGDAKNALEHHQRAYELHKKLGDLQAMAVDLGNIRFAHIMKGDPFKTRNITNKYLLSEKLDDLQPQKVQEQKKRKISRGQSELEKIKSPNFQEVVVHFKHARDPSYTPYDYSPLKKISEYKSPLVINGGIKSYEDFLGIVKNIPNKKNIAGFKRNYYFSSQAFCFQSAGN
jgi:hypothetical protein